MRMCVIVVGHAQGSIREQTDSEIFIREEASKRDYVL